MSGRALKFRAADDGSSTVEMVVITPVMMLVLMVVVQFAAYFCALHVAQAGGRHQQRARPYRRRDV